MGRQAKKTDLIERLQIKISQDLLDKICNEAALKGVDVSKLVREILEKHLFITTIWDKENHKIYKLPKEEQYWYPRKDIDKEYDEKETYTKPIYHIRWIFATFKRYIAVERN